MFSLYIPLMYIFLWLLLYSFSFVDYLIFSLSRAIRWSYLIFLFDARWYFLTTVSFVFHCWVRYPLVQMPSPHISPEYTINWCRCIYVGVCRHICHPHSCWWVCGVVVLLGLELLCRRFYSSTSYCISQSPCILPFSTLFLVHLLWNQNFFSFQCDDFLSMDRHDSTCREPIPPRLSSSMNGYFFFLYGKK